MKKSIILIIVALILLVLFVMIPKKETLSYFGLRLWECDN